MIGYRQREVCARVRRWCGGELLYPLASLTPFVARNERKKTRRWACRWRKSIQEVLRSVYHSVKDRNPGDMSLTNCQVLRGRAYMLCASLTMVDRRERNKTRRSRSTVFVCLFWSWRSCTKRLVLCRKVLQARRKDEGDMRRITQVRALNNGRINKPFWWDFDVTMGGSKR